MRAYLLDGYLVLNKGGRGGRQKIREKHCIMQDSVRSFSSHARMFVEKVVVEMHGHLQRR
jgi:hypothetical protein